MSKRKIWRSSWIHVSLRLFLSVSKQPSHMYGSDVRNSSTAGWGSPWSLCIFTTITSTTTAFDEDRWLPAYIGRPTAAPPRTASILLPPPYCRHTAIADTAVAHVLRLAPPRAIQSSCIHTPYELAGRHRAQGVLLVCFAAGTAAGASVASASIEGIVENVVQVQCTVRFMQ